MSVKVVSPTDSGQPQLPMSLRPPTAGAAVEPPASPRLPGVEPGQTELPMPLRPAAVAFGQPEPSPAPAAGADSRQLPLPLRSPVTDSGQSELPMRLPAAPAAGADSAQPQAPMPVRPPAVASGQPVRTSVVDHRQSELPMPLRAPATVSVQPEPPASSSSAVASGQSELPMPVRSPVVDHPRPLPQAPMPVRPPAVASGQPVRAPVVDHPQPPLPLSRTSAAEAGRSPGSVPRPPVVEHRQSQLPMSLRPPAPPAAAGLLAQARRGLAEAERETDAAERFIGAYLAALRGAAAVLAARGRPHRGRARPASTWVLLDSVVPELREWSAFFASNSATRAAAQAGITGKVTAESADELVRVATPFLELVRRLVHGLPITGEAHVA
ncbi:SAV_6107 family HEPN domain-containing protein [Amycolatopsis sp. cmx-4-68]|uniref:SAV_6107 family HEPN domain-containing protein n=1 Tax=Amycolatopsis sp. cmx-4-68 TaxID=2790938 RepID=UPI00397A8590